MWILVRTVDVTIVRDNEAWVMNEIVASSNHVLAPVGTLNVVGWLDGGTPGRNGDMIFSTLDPYVFFDGMNAQLIYDSLILGDPPFDDPWLSPVTKGNVVVKP